MANVNIQLAEIAAKIDGKPAAESEAVDETPIDNDNITPGVDASDGDVDNSDNAVEASDGDDIKTFAELATAIDVTPEYLYGMEIGMGDNEDAIPLGKLKDIYQDTLRNQTKLQEQLEAQTEQLAQAQKGMLGNQSINNEMQMAQAEMIQLNNQYSSIDWAQYEQDDPGAAALARQKFQEANGVAQQRYGQAQQQMQQQSQAGLQDAAAHLSELIPAWKDETVRAADVGKVKALMREVGYSESAIAGARDYRAIALLHELIGYREQAKAATEAVKQVRNAPKVLTGRGKFQAKKEDETATLTRKARTSGARKDEEKAVKSILGLK